MNVRVLATLARPKNEERMNFEGDVGWVGA